MEDVNQTIIGCLYRSPSSSVSAFCNELNIVLDKLSSEKKNVLILGDININLLDDCSAATIAYTDCLHGFGLESLVSLPTRCTPGSSSTLIDHIFSNHLCPPVCGVLENNITDHFPIFFKLPCQLHKPCHKFNKAVINKDDYITQVSKLKWSSINSESDVDLAFNEFSDSIKQCIVNSTEIVRCRRHIPALQNPWLTNGLLTSLRKKDNLYRKVKKRPFNIRLRTRYKVYCNQLNKLLKEAKKNILRTSNS